MLIAGFALVRIRVLHHSNIRACNAFIDEANFACATFNSIACLHKIIEELAITSITGYACLCVQVPYFIIIKAVVALAVRDIEAHSIRRTLSLILIYIIILFTFRSVPIFVLAGASYTFLCNEREHLLDSSAISAHTCCYIPIFINLKARHACLNAFNPLLLPIYARNTRLSLNIPHFFVN